LQAPRSAKTKKTKLNVKPVLHLFTLIPSYSKECFEEGNDIPLIDHTNAFPFAIQESVLCQARQQPQDWKVCANECSDFFIVKTPEYQSGWNPIYIGNSISYSSPRRRYVITLNKIVTSSSILLSLHLTTKFQSGRGCYPWNYLGMTNLKAVEPSHMTYLMDLQKNGFNALSENCSLHAINIHHYPNTNTSATSDICGHLAKTSIIPEHTCSNSGETEVWKDMLHVATQIWCKGPSPKQEQD
jgi:hypothetical protein